MEDNHNRQDMDDNKSGKDDKKTGLSAKLRAFIAGLTPATVFKYTFLSSVIVALAATILYRTASESLHVNIDKVDTASIDLEGSQDGKESVEYLEFKIRMFDSPRAVGMDGKNVILKNEMETTVIEF